MFALANAGVTLPDGSPDAAQLRVSLAVALGLLAGKPLGILAACGVALRLRLATLPAGIGWRQLLVLGLVAGIGFTMSLFVAQLAFASAALLDAAKLGVLCGSGLSAVLGVGVGWLVLRPPAAPHAVRVAATADEAERSTEL
jgi:NhaA family Na+:H+ antiporter